MNDVSVEDQGAMAVEFLDGLLESFGLNGSAGVVAVDEGTVEVEVTGESLGLLIGPGGHTFNLIHRVVNDLTVGAVH